MSDSEQNTGPLADDWHPFGHLIGLEFSGWGEGQSSCHLEVKATLRNPNGVLYGAVIYAMADTGMGGALVSTLETGQVCTTVEVKSLIFEPFWLVGVMVLANWQVRPALTYAILLLFSAGHAPQLSSQLFCALIALWLLGRPLPIPQSQKKTLLQTVMRHYPKPG